MILQTSTYLTVLCGNNAENRRFSAGERFEFLKTVPYGGFLLLCVNKGWTVFVSKERYSIYFKDEETRSFEAEWGAPCD